MTWEGTPAAFLSCCCGRCRCSGGATLTHDGSTSCSRCSKHRTSAEVKTGLGGGLSNPCLARGKKNGGLRWIFYLGAHSCSYELSFAAVRNTCQFQTFLTCHLRQTTHPPAWLRWYAGNNNAKSLLLKASGGDHTCVGDVRVEKSSLCGRFQSATCMQPT
jgi:hypothetical protein